MSPTRERQTRSGRAHSKTSYSAAGVNIDTMMHALKAVKRLVRGTHVPGVVSDMGAFGGQFESPGRGSVLVASTDGVGTKLKVAALANRHRTVGQDLVNHCVNDILVQGAHPLFFLDYLGTATLRADVFHDVVWGLCRACRQNACALLGGETAEMPGLYPKEEYDLVGTIVGSVKRRDVIDGSRIRPGDLLIGLPSSGLHTNGFSLARRILFRDMGLTVHDAFPGSRRTVADVLLAVHRSYLSPVSNVLSASRITGMAHITGGGLVDNLPRILPDGTRVDIDTTSWRPPAVFRVLQRQGKVDVDEMYRVFNMGIGYVLVGRPKDIPEILEALAGSCRGARVIGAVRKGKGGVTLTGLPTR